PGGGRGPSPAGGLRRPAPRRRLRLRCRGRRARRRCRASRVGSCVHPSGALLRVVLPTAGTGVLQDSPRGQGARASAPSRTRTGACRPPAFDWWRSRRAGAPPSCVLRRSDRAQPVRYETLAGRSLAVTSVYQSVLALKVGGSTPSITTPGPGSRRTPPISSSRCRVQRRGVPPSEWFIVQPVTAPWPQLSLARSPKGLVAPIE